jgi:hypothetical protein
MLSLRRLKLEDIEVQSLAHMMHESNGVILEFNSLESFKLNFNKYFLVLQDFKEKIHAVSACDHSVFEHEVYIISAIEDKLNIAVNNYFIKAQEETTIRLLSDFYFDDINDGSFELNLITTPYRNPITIMEWILLSNLSGGVNIAIDMKTINPVWLETEEIFNAIYPYVNGFMYDEYVQVVK